MFKTLELLAEWMMVGMYDFSILPFSLKVHMSEEDRERLHSVREKQQGKGVSNGFNHPVCSSSDV